MDILTMITAVGEVAKSTLQPENRYPYDIQREYNENLSPKYSQALGRQISSGIIEDINRPDLFDVDRMSAVTVQYQYVAGGYGLKFRKIKK